MMQRAARASWAASCWRAAPCRFFCCQFSKEKYLLESPPEKLRKELEEELKLSAADIRSHGWYHGHIPREVSGAWWVNAHLLSAVTADMYLTNHKRGQNCLKQAETPVSCMLTWIRGGAPVQFCSQPPGVAETFWPHFVVCQWWSKTRHRRKPFSHHFWHLVQEKKDKFVEISNTLHFVLKPRICCFTKALSVTAVWLFSCSGFVLIINSISVRLLNKLIHLKR